MQPGAFHKSIPLIWFRARYKQTTSNLTGAANPLIVSLQLAFMWSKIQPKLPAEQPPFSANVRPFSKVSSWLERETGNPLEREHSKPNNHRIHSRICLGWFSFPESSPSISTEA